MMIPRYRRDNDNALLRYSTNSVVVITRRLQQPVVCNNSIGVSLMKLHNRDHPSLYTVCVFINTQLIYNEIDSG